MFDSLASTGMFGPYAGQAPAPAQGPQGQGNQPLQMDPRIAGQRQANGLNPMHHGPDDPSAGPPQPSAVPPPDDAITSFNKWLAAQGSGRLNIDPSNPSAAIGKQGTEPVPGAVPVAGKIDGGYPAQANPAPANPDPSTNTFNRGAGILPAMPTSPSQSGYLAAHAKAMGVTPDQLRELMKSDPEIGFGMARTDATNSIQQSRQQLLDRAQFGDPNALHGLLTGYNSAGITPGEGARILAGMRQGQAASLAEREFGLKKSEHDVAMAKVNEQGQREWDKTKAGFLGQGDSDEQAEAKTVRSIGPRPTLGVGQPGGQLGGPTPAGQGAGARPGQAPVTPVNQLAARSDLLGRLSTQLAPGKGGKPSITLPEMMTAVYKEDAANPGYFNANRNQLLSTINSVFGPNALQSQLTGGGQMFYGLRNNWNHIGGVSDDTAAQDAFRNALGIGQPTSLLGYIGGRLTGNYDR